MIIGARHTGRVVWRRRHATRHYVGYVLVRGLIAGEYPYTILDPTFAPPTHAAQGYLGVAIGVGILVVLVAIFDLLLVAVDGLIARRVKPA